jgi:hypothetical protein
VQIGHLSLEELHVGATETDSLHVDDDRAARCEGRGRVHHRARVRLRKFNRTHCVQIVVSDVERLRRAS